jgi:hypothetical protein
MALWRSPGWIESRPDAHEVVGLQVVVGAKREQQRLVLREIVDETPIQFRRSGDAAQPVGRIAGQAHELGELGRVLGKVVQAQRAEGFGGEIDGFGQGYLRGLVTALMLP